MKYASRLKRAEAACVPPGRCHEGVTCMIEAGEPIPPDAARCSRCGEQEKRLVTCCVITTNANELVRPFHDRMPAILSPADYAMWFDADTPLANLRAVLKPYPAELMDVSAANPLVNSPKNEGPQLLDPAA